MSADVSLALIKSFVSSPSNVFFCSARYDTNRSYRRGACRSKSTIPGSISRINRSLMIMTIDSISSPHRRVRLHLADSQRKTNVSFVLDFFTREGERFMREDPLLPFSNSILTDITHNQDQSWSHEQAPGSPGCSTTTFFMAKSSTPDEMLNALLTGKGDGMSSKENQQQTSLRTLTAGWNEQSLMSKKSVSGLNLRQQKDSPFHEVPH